MTTGSYLVACPELGEREIVYGSERAADVCYSMHCESEGAYAFVEDWLGHTFMEYGEPSNWNLMIYIITALSVIVIIIAIS